MSQKYQNEKSPVLNGKKMSKISEKVPKIRDLEGPTAFRPFENTRYVLLTEIVLSRYDPSNPVVCYDGELRTDLYKKVCGM